MNMRLRMYKVLLFTFRRHLCKESILYLIFRLAPFKAPFPLKGKGPNDDDDFSVGSVSFVLFG